MTDAPTKDTFYLTTPIYYINDLPHIGHAYTTIAADVLARWRRAHGEKVLFLTGTDEHGQKVARAAEAGGLDPQAWTDRMVDRWKATWAELDVAYDDFIRTTEPRHVGAVKRLWQRLYDQGDVYLDSYQGLYCVACEQFYSPDELVDGKCPIHGTPVETVREENYFFRISKYADRLLEHYRAHPEFVRPETRLREVVSFVEQGLQDLSISRSSFTWGVPIPWDPRHVMYVWVDALQNYLTAAGWDADLDRFAHVWPADYHFVGKDILRFHAVTWPAILLAAGLEPPRTVQAHGWLLVGGEKMSKTKLTGIAPGDLVAPFGSDAVRYFFQREVAFGQDGNFSWEAIVERYNADLANGLGNLASRLTAMVERYRDGVLPGPGRDQGAEAETAVRDAAARAYADAEAALADLAYERALAAIWRVVAAANAYLSERRPWDLAKAGDDAALDTVLYTGAEALRIVAVLAAPWLTRTAPRLWAALGAPGELADARLPGALAWGGLPRGARVQRVGALFPRLDAEGRPAERSA
ncbi:MAG TPA: methionine--tRNA ligase [Actinomycetes bacterium]|nr:methionine--tRNA ligase [Actinomycetes bacterium]